MSIAIFDSGYGGLTIMREIVKKLPQYDYLYLGDNARTPYGNRSKQTILRFTEEAVTFLFEAGAKLIIFGCNVASALALRDSQEKYLRNPVSPYRDRKILGVIRPIAEKAISESISGRIGVAATRATVASGAFEKELKKLKASVSVFQKACPLLVPLIEEGWHVKPEAKVILKKYLRPLKAAHIDLLILGCTHYPLMIKDFRRIMGRGVHVLNSGEIVAESLVNYLKRHPEIETKLSKNGERKFMTTDAPDRFKDFVDTFSGMDIKNVVQVKI